MENSDFECVNIESKANNNPNGYQIPTVTIMANTAIFRFNVIAVKNFGLELGKFACLYFGSTKKIVVIKITDSKSTETFSEPIHKAKGTPTSSPTTWIGCLSFCNRCKIDYTKTLTYELKEGNGFIYFDLNAGIVSKWGRKKIKDVVI